jgi:hypothetical protein
VPTMKNRAPNGVPGERAFSLASAMGLPTKAGFGTPTKPIEPVFDNIRGGGGRGGSGKKGKSFPTITGIDDVKTRIALPSAKAQAKRKQRKAG